MAAEIIDLHIAGRQKAAQTWI